MSTRLIDQIAIYWRGTPYKLLKHLNLDCSHEITKYDCALWQRSSWGDDLFRFEFGITAEWHDNNLDSTFAFFGNAIGGGVTPVSLPTNGFSELNGYYRDNSAQFNYCYADYEVFNIYIFNTKANFETFLTLSTIAEKEAFAKDHAMNEVKSPSPYVDYNVYLSKSDIPLIDISWNPNDNGNTGIKWETIELYVEYSQLGSSKEYYKSYELGYNHIAFTWDEIRNFVKSKHPLQTLFGITELKIELFSSYRDDNVMQTTKRMYFYVYSNGNTASNTHGSSIDTPVDDDSTITLHMGFMEDDEEYESFTDRIDPFYDIPSIIEDEKAYSTNGVGCRQYILSRTKMNELCSWLWTSNLIENIKKVQTNPIENIVSCKMFPFDFEGVSGNTIHIGNVDTEINASKLPSNYNAVRTITTIHVSEYYHNFLDYMTNVYIYLPFIGIKQLDTSIVMNRDIKVQYVVDVVSGMCNCLLFVDNMMIYKFSGTMGIDISLTSNNRVELEKAYVSSALSTVGNVAAQNYGGAIMSAVSGAMASTHISTSGNFAPNCEGYSDRHIYLIYDRPQHQLSNQYYHTHGGPCELTLNLSGLSGYTELSDGVDLSGIPCTSEEMDLLRSILIDGFYL